MEERMCPCGCGETWETAVREVSRAMKLNEDQAEDWLMEQVQSETE